MPDLEETQMGAPEDSAAAVPSEDAMQGLSKSASADLGLFDEEPAASAVAPELGEEFKPYSQFPWEDLPEEVREPFLEKLKKFHGDMSRGVNEAAQLRKDVEQFRQKADWFDTLTSQKWFQDAYLQQQGGGQPAQDKPAPVKLSQYGLDDEAGDAIERVIQERVGNALGPLTQQLQYLQRKVMSDTTDRELQEVREIAKQKGLPSPDEKMSRMTQIIQSGEARTVKDAWRLAIFDELPDIVSKNARKAAQEELRNKAASTLPPRVGPATEPGEEIFVGPNAVSEALHAAIAEHARAAKGR